MRWSEHTKLPRGVKRDPPPDPDPPPNEWQPLQIETDSEYSHGHSQLPPGLHDSSAIELFQLFFTDELLKELAFYTNGLAEEYYRESRKTTGESAGEWKPTCKRELYPYLGVLLYMALHHEPSIGDYWKTSNDCLSDYPLRYYISRNRFEQIDHFLYCTPAGQSFQRPFGRIIHISDYVKMRAQRYFKPGPNGAVDEVIQRFHRRASEIVNIPHKPTGKGFKI